MEGADPSLPLALGGAGMSVRELGDLYAALANDGQVAAPHLTQDATESRPLLTPRAAAMVADVLTQKIPDVEPYGLAWKTGTSWGGRDAWAAGFAETHVLVAWVARPYRMRRDARWHEPMRCRHRRQSSPVVSSAAIANL